jgi:hypothetical protein
MENNQNNQNNQINFKSTVVNAELSINLAEFKILSEFLTNSMIYYYQTKYTNKSYTKDEYNLIFDKYQKLKLIVDNTLRDFSEELNLTIPFEDQ